MVERVIAYLTEKILVTFFLNVLVHEMCYSNRFYRAMIKQYYSRMEASEKSTATYGISKIKNK